MATLYIQLLGEFQLIYDDIPLAAVHSPRLQSLLAYLLLHRNAPQSRRRLAFLFWPASAESQAHSNLRKLFHQLRQVLPEPEQFLQYDNLTIQWHPNALATIDIDQLDQQLTTIAQMPFNLSRLTHVVELYTGLLLPDCYDDWIIPFRQKYQRAVEEVLERLVTALANQQAYAEGARYAQQLLDLDPLEETSYQHLMRLRNLRGDRAGALRVYYDCVRILKRELGVEPSATTQKIYEQIVNLAQPISASTSVLPTRTSAPTSLATVPFVGRGETWQQMQLAWQKANQGTPHLLMVAGEAGIGKTRLAEELLIWANQQGIRSARTRSYAAQGELAYAPISELLRSPMLRPHLNKLSHLWLTEVARLLPELLTEYPTLTPPGSLTESWQRQRFFEALARAFLIDEQPLLLLLDDLQWCHEETLRWLHFLLHFAPHAPLLLVGTLRIEEVDHNHPIRTLQLELQRNEQWAEVNLLPLNQEDVASLAYQMSGTAITAAEAQQLYQITEGNPLFVVETIRADTWRTTAMKTMASNHQALSLDPAQTLPPKVYAIVRMRLNQLSTLAQELVSIAATIGRAFTFEQLAAVSKQEEGKLLNGLDELWQRRIVREHGANSYDFSHDRIREVAYASLSRTRQRLLHQQIAQAFEKLYVERLHEVSAQLAVHYAQADEFRKAIRYYQQAAETAKQIHANEVAISHYRQALILVEQLPASEERRQCELHLLIGLGASLRIVKGRGANDVQQIYLQAKELSQSLGNMDELLLVLNGLTECYRIRAEYEHGSVSGEQLLTLAQVSQNAEYAAIAAFQLGLIAYGRGAFVSAHTYLEQAIHFYGSPQRYPKLHLKRANILWLLGYPEQALQIHQNLLMLTQDEGNPVDTVDLLGNLIELQLLTGKWQNLDAQIERMVTLSHTYQFAQPLSWATYLQGWQRTHAGRESGIAQMQQGLADYLATGGQNSRTCYLIRLGEVSMRMGQLQEATTFLTQADEVMDQTNERFWEAELHRLRGEQLLIQHQDQQHAAEAYFQRALTVARQQQAKALELRAAMNLGRLWLTQGRNTDAHTLLAEIYGWFTEGFLLPDWQAAKRLLTTLA